VQIYGDNATKETAVYNLGTLFSEGRESATDEESSGSPTTSRAEENIAKIRQILGEYLWLTFRNIANKANIDRETIRKILTESLA
jgi:DNA-directed RNA polymerase sigma subunit (sigma70/sigma32)